MKRYTGITIGPVYETMELTNKLDELWLGSYMFSKFSYLLQEELKDYSIITPNMGDKKDSLIQECFNNGIGMFDDRIIVEGEIDNLDLLKQNACRTLAKDFDGVSGLNQDSAYEVLYQYIQTGIVVKDIEDDKNVVLEFDNDLAKADFNRHIVDNKLVVELNKFKRIFSSNSHDNARKIKNIFVKREDYNQYIYDILGGSVNRREKYNNYYVCLNSDGDRFSKYLCRISKSEDIQEFSCNCFLYAKEVASLVRNYGGVSVYQGGDDVLCILPLILKEGNKNIFEFLEEYIVLFDKYFNKYNEGLNDDEKITLSAALEVRYYKSPLYEAVVDARNDLHEIKDNGRDGLIINFVKHSGQTNKFVIKNVSVKRKLENNNLNTIFEKASTYINKGDENSLPAKSIKTNIRKYNDLIEFTLYKDYENNTSLLSNLLSNIYSDCNNETKEMFRFIVDILNISFKDVMDVNKNSDDINEKDNESDYAINNALSLLGIINFWGEKNEKTN